MAGKSRRYEALGVYLGARRDQSTVPMSFAEIEAIVGDLPASKQYPAWWSNNPSNNPLTAVWIEAGFRSEQVDIGRGRLVFRNHAKIERDLREIARDVGFCPESLAQGMAEEPGEFGDEEEVHLPRHPALGALKGTFTIEPGYDLTKPMMDDDEIAEWEANMERTADLIDRGLRTKKDE